MRRFVLLICLAVIQIGFSQRFSMDSLRFSESENNILVQRITGDSLSTTFFIAIKHEVKLHKHLNHSETIYVLQGTGRMQLGDTWFDIGSGDLVFIPKNTPHKVFTTSDIPLQVISIQSPEFDGSDRILLE